MKLRWLNGLDAWILRRFLLQLDCGFGDVVPVVEERR
jgi:hypothetical protein